MHAQGTAHFHLSYSSLLTTIIIKAKLQIPALVRDKKRWADRQRGGGRWGPTHRHESENVIASQQSQQHSLTAHPNNQLRAEDSSQQRREKSLGVPGKTSGSDSAVVNSYAGFFTDSCQLWIMFLPLHAVHAL